jgi:phospho-N-acetylmuramoyl-pentapeptide-transferase
LRSADAVASLRSACRAFAALAAIAAWALVLLTGPRWISWLRARFREPIKSASADVERLHQAKQNTPTMGGIFVVAAIVLATLAFGDGWNGYVAIALVLCLALGAVGACDDLVKLTTARRGLRARTKLAAQVVLALAAATAVYALHRQVEGALDLRVPLLGTTWHLGPLFIPLATLVIVGSSNAVNVTDGLDGLAGGCLVLATAALALVTFACGDAAWAGSLGIPTIAGAAEMTVVAAATIGALLGFLWFNCHPAAVFLGDTGSLPLGGLLGLLAVVARQELLLIVIGAVFVAEVASVILQVAWLRWTRRRLFLCAPVHHHWQLRGWPEGKIVARMWIAGALSALAGLALLKLYANDAAGLRFAARNVRPAASLPDVANLSAKRPN